MDSNEEKVLHQLEFYFGDSNYPKDKFLRAQAALDEKGFVSLNVISTFKRMKELGVTDIKELARIAAKSNQIEVKEDGTAIKRKNPLPEADLSSPRTIYTKGWPQGINIEDVKEVFKPFGSVLCVRIRKDQKKEQKDSVFIEMGSEEEAKNVISKGVKFKDIDLKILSKAEYLQNKKEERKQKREKKKNESQPTSDISEQKKEEKAEEIVEGLIIKLTDIPDYNTREILKASFSRHAKIVYVDFSKGDKEGYLRVETPESAKKIVEALSTEEEKKRLDGINVKLIEGEEEKQYYAKIAELKLKRKKKLGEKKKNKRRRF